MRSALPIAIALFPSLLPAQDPAHGKGLQGRVSGLQLAEPDARDRELRMTPAVRAVLKAADSVVSIYINHDVRGLDGNGGAFTEGQGSGVILDETGFVITNWHVIAATLGRRDYSVQVRLRDGRKRDTDVVSSSDVNDLALLKIRAENGEHFKPIEIGRSSDLMIGETLIAIGNPQGHANTVTQGVLSATGRAIRAIGPDRQPRQYSGLLQTDAAINPGNSGGALLDITGKLIGINNAMAANAENIGFAIPVDTVREVFEKNLTQTDAFAAWLGMEMGEVDGRLVVKSVVPGGPAAQAGVHQGDGVVAAGGAPVMTLLDYTRSVLGARTGHPFPLRLRRGGQDLGAEPRPIDREEGEILALSGLAVDEVAAEDDSDLAHRVARTYYHNRRAPLFPVMLRVRSVQPGSPAAALDLQVSDVVLAVTFNNRDYPIESAHALADLLHRTEGSNLHVVVVRGTEDLTGSLDVRRRQP
jgi:serine protease Do